LLVLLVVAVPADGLLLDLLNLLELRLPLLESLLGGAAARLLVLALEQVSDLGVACREHRILIYIE
jgi:hypothetical protein